jgi:hypothetical protein
MQLVTTTMKISALFAALVAAWFWFRAARIDTPATFHITVTTPGMRMPGDSDLVGVGHSASLARLGQQLALQSKLNADAAIAAACGILMEFCSIILGFFTFGNARV